jgi:pyridoxal phosphate enzyme (YggS family)
MVCENYVRIRERIDEACRVCGRDPGSVTLIAVSKTKPVSMIRELMEIGVEDFGENHAQELVSKTEEITTPLRWHFIGNLQTNKVKYVVGRACLIHSVNSLHLAEAISKESVKKNLVSDILIEVNIADESTKEGIAEDDAIELVENASKLPWLRIHGLMAIAPPVDDPEENRPYFRRLRELALKIDGLGLDGVEMKELSMGMTNDFTCAVEEGATFVRVRTAIFGERNYH